MMKLIKYLVDRYYNQEVEDFCTRLLYFFNTIDSYFFLAGSSSYLICVYYFPVPPISVLGFLLISAAVMMVYRVADFYPLFLVFSPIYFYFLFGAPQFSGSIAGILLLANFGIFLLVQVCFMGFPDSIVARDPTISIRKVWNSIFTVAPTTVSLSMSVFFSTVFSLVLAFQPNPLGGFEDMAFWVSFCVAGGITFYYKPKSFISNSFKPEAKEKIAEKVIVLNIDGCRLDRFYEAELPFLTVLSKKNTYFPKGLKTVYRALTNPAFASILTGTVPEMHGIKNNNLGQVIRVDGLPDLVKSKLYGSMHVKHFSKPHWDTKVVSLPTHGIYKSDDIMIDHLKEGLLTEDGTRLFVADLSEVDFLGHAYGSESWQYLEAIKRADKRIEHFFGFLDEKGLAQDSVVIICSDHGMIRIDHSYLLSDAEMYVPFIIAGEKIKENQQLDYEASIMDIALTISYILGIPYPNKSNGRVFIEVLK